MEHPAGSPSISRTKEPDLGFFFTINRSVLTSAQTALSNRFKILLSCSATRHLTEGGHDRLDGRKAS